MEFREAKKNDLEGFLAFRMEFTSLIGNIDDKEGFKAKTRAYLEKHLGGDDLIVFLALDGEKIVSSCMACIFETAPLPSCHSGRIAELLNVYTLPEYRRRGYAEELLRLLIEEAKKREVGKLLLDYTDQGHPLYQKMGFEELPRQMKMTLK